MNENPLIEFTAYWNGYISPLQDFLCEYSNNLAAVHTVLYSITAASETNNQTKTRYIYNSLQYHNFFHDVLSRIYHCAYFRGLHGSCWCSMLWGFKRFQHEVVGFCGSIIWKSCWDNTPTHTHAQRLSSWDCGLSLFLPGKGLLENLRDRQGRQKVETSSDLTAINSLVICSCLPTLTTLVLVAVWSMGHGPQPLWSEVDPSDYTLGNCTFSLLLLSLSLS